MARAVRSQRDRHARAEFLRAVAQLDQLLAAAGGEHTVNAERRRQLAELKTRLDADVARVAVVGPVKSGKSTLLNALIGHDLLPRGAGVLTAQVTELRHGPRAAVEVEWISPADADAEFSRLLNSLGHSGHWSLEIPEHLTRARAAVSGSTAPLAATVSAMLNGYPAARAHLGTCQPDLPLPGDGLTHWVTRDDVAIFLRGLRVTTPSSNLPAGVALLDCQGYDAWNPWHGAELLAALQGAHAVVYVVSSRVGFRDADQRLLEQLQGLGLLRLTRFVLNVDWGELRRPGELRRVHDVVRQRVSEFGGDEPSLFSALQSLVEHLALVEPETVSAGEHRLLDAWDADNAGGMATSRESFAQFREALWYDAEEERDATVLQRLRADLRILLVAAAAELRHTTPGGVRRLAWEEDAADRVLRWAQQRIDRVVFDSRQRLRERVAVEFAGRRAPHRQTWQRVVAASLENTTAAAAHLDPALDALTRTESLRINAVRNLALEVRGELARRAEELGAEMAVRLSQAGLEPRSPLLRTALSREIVVTRRIPLFATIATRALRAPPVETPAHRPILARALRRFGHSPAAESKGTGRLGRVSHVAAGALLRTRLRSAWDDYLEQVLEQCLLPHAEEAAADIYACLATWVLEQLHHDTRDVAELLAHCRTT